MRHPLSSRSLRAATGLALLSVLISFTGCQHPPAPRYTGPVSEIPEIWFSPRQESDNIDSPAAWRGPEGQYWCLATAKTGDVVVVLDARTGRELRRLGGPGAAPGRTERPNGIWVEDNWLFVVERDNHRLQVFSLPDGTPLGVCGAAELVKPYGLYVQPEGSGRYRVFVTDNYETPEGAVPPASELGRRVHRFDLTLAPTGLQVREHVPFGETGGPGVLRVVESIAGDPVHNRMLLSEEETDAALGGLCVKVYDFSGRYTGTSFGEGIFLSQVEGIALDARPDGSGYWIVTDQSYTDNLFHVFERVTLRHLGTFRGPGTTNTDGIWLDSRPFPEAGFSRGLFFAVHNDGNVAAFDYAAILQALGLP